MDSQKISFLTLAAVIALCITASSVEPIAAKFCYTALIITPFALLIVKFIAGGLISLPSIFLSKKMALRDICRIVPIAVLLILTTGALFLSLKDLSATMVITIITTTPAFVAFVNNARGRARLGKLFWPGFILCFAGIFLTLDISSFMSNMTLGTVRGFAFAALSVAMSTMYRTRLEVITESYSSKLISAWMFVICLAISLGCLPFIGSVSKEGIFIGAGLGAAAVIANITFVKSIQLLGSTRMSIISLIQRPVVIFLAAFLLKEPLTAIQIIGIIMVIIGISIAKAEKCTKQQV